MTLKATVNDFLYIVMLIKLLGKPLCSVHEDGVILKETTPIIILVQELCIALQ